MGKVIPELHMNVKKYIRGSCFLCHTPCNPDGYMHHSCGIAYTDDKEKRLKEFWEENGEKI